MSRAAVDLQTPVGIDGVVAHGRTNPDPHDLSSVPWMVWAIDHPCEAEQAEDWLRAADQQVAGSEESDGAPAESEPEQRSVTPWMLWAIDHPYEAERAEAWLEAVANGDMVVDTIDSPAPAAATGSSPVSSATRRSHDDRLPGWRRAFGASVTAVLAFALILVTLIGYGRLDNRWYHLVTVQGGSMEPTYSIGDILVLTRPPAHIEVGMVLTMQVDGSVVTHRVVEVADDGSFVTQGDANDYPDDFSGADVRVVGQVRGVVPWVGKYLGGRASTNAWFNDRAVASAYASAATTLAPAPADAVIAAQTIDEPVEPVEEPVEEPAPPKVEPAAGDAIDVSTGDATTKDTAADEPTSEPTGGEPIEDATVVDDTTTQESDDAATEPAGDPNSGLNG